MSAWADPERVERLKRMWADGLSASEIAKCLGGVSRNGVIGKVHRMGLAKRHAATDPGEKVVRRPRPPVREYVPPEPRKRPNNFLAFNSQRQPQAQPLPQLRCVEADSRPVPFIDRANDQCAFILDGFDEPTCCGAQVVGKGSWCKAHGSGFATTGKGAPLAERYYANLGNRQEIKRTRERTEDLLGEAA